MEQPLFVHREEFEVLEMAGSALVIRVMASGEVEVIARQEYTRTQLSDLLTALAQLVAKE